MRTDRKTLGRGRRHRRVRKKISGTAGRPRLAVYRSNRHIYAQVIDDTAGRTLAAASTLIEGVGGDDPTERAKSVGKTVAQKAREAGVDQVVFDRGGFRYHGKVKAVADGAREAGLQL